MLFLLAQVGVIEPRKPPAGWYVRICTGRVADNLEIKLEIDFDFFSVDFLCHMSFGQLLHSSVRPRCCGWADESSSPFDLWSIFCVFFLIIAVISVILSPFENLFLAIAFDFRMISFRSPTSLLYFLIAWPASDCCCHCRAPSRCDWSLPNGRWKEKMMETMARIVMNVVMMVMMTMIIYYMKFTDHL